MTKKNITSQIWINYILIWFIYIIFLMYSSGFLISKLPTLEETIISMLYLALFNYGGLIYFFLESFGISFLKGVGVFLSIINPIITYFIVKFYVNKLGNKSIIYSYIISILFAIGGIFLYFISLFAFDLFW